MKAETVKKFINRIWKECRFVVLFTVLIVVPVKSSLADWNWVPTGSMKPTILEGDLIYINKVAYDLRFPLTLHRIARWSDPQRGDVVVCFSPDDGTRLVKRVIALPGETIEMKDNRLLIDGRPVEYTEIDPKYAESVQGQLQGRYVLATEDLDGYDHVVMSIPYIPAMRSFAAVKVPQGSYFVMGDNRDNSKDSRYFGFVARDQIVGRAAGVIGSLNITDKYQPRLSRFFSSLK